MPGNRKSIRLRNYDYSDEGYYFITICVKEMVCSLGEIDYSGLDSSSPE